MKTKAIVFALLAALSLSVMAFLMKEVSSIYDSSAIIFWRFIVSLLYSTAVYRIRPSKVFRAEQIVPHCWLHVLRAVTTTSAMWCLASSLKFISPVAANTLNLTHPIFLVILLMAFRREGGSKPVLLFCAVGFVGIVLSLGPNFSSGDGLGYLLATLSGFFTAASYLSIKIMSSKTAPSDLLFVNSLFCAIFSLFACSVLGVDMLHVGASAFTLFLACIAGSLYQDFIIRSLTLSSPSVSASLMYCSVPFSMILSHGKIDANPEFLLGIVLICVSGISISLIKE